MAVRRPFVFALLVAIVVGVMVAVLSPGPGAPAAPSSSAPVATTVHVRAPGWLAATRVVLPSGAEGIYGNPSVACTGPGSCVVVGGYADAKGAAVPMVAIETSRHWGPARPLIAPADAAQGSYQLAALQSVACTSVGDCAAVGSYANTKHVDRPMVVTETDGKWGRARTVRLPASASTPRGELPTGLSSLTCTSPGN